MYLALVLDEESHNKLIAACDIPKDWSVKAHHMTIHMGSAGKDTIMLIGKGFRLVAEYIAKNNRVMAVTVSTNCPSKNKVKHITVAVNTVIGAKPKESNDLQDWKSIDPIVLTGTVKEVV